ncbi:DNA alkylation repair protein [bacterium]|nr:DNA alkylation repair protein [bacterium]
METLLKDRFFNPTSLATFAGEIGKHCSEFDPETFVAAVQSGDWKDLELKQRMRRTTEVLHRTLDRPYAEALPILMDAAPEITGFEAMVLPDYVEVYGLEDWDRSLPALKHFTRYSSSEFAIRPYLNADLDRAMGLMRECAGDEHENVRRFASEGCRPRLPWAAAVPELKRDPSPILPILERLKDDPSEFVRRSVANNLNDISKDFPELVLEIAGRWHGTSTNTDKLLKHALRTLLKQGNTTALAFFGTADTTGLSIENYSLGTDRIQIGGDGRLSFELIVEGSNPKQVRLEYAVYYVKANGGTYKKVFKIAEKEFPQGRHEITRKYHFQNLTTRKHYPGEHVIAVHVNGVEMGRRNLVLLATK